eukprot:jgi/Botrbrau1/5066/Bobra.37_1s0030.1
MGPLGDNSKPYTLILDLDETLVYCYDLGTFMSNPVYLPDAVIAFPSEALEGETVELLVCLRPGLENFLRDVSQFYEIAIFSAGMPNYVHTILQKIDPNRRFIQSVFTRDHASVYSRRHITKRSDLFVKDISGLFEGDNRRRIERVVAVDDRIHYWPKHLDNVIPIRPFRGNPDDSELSALLEVLQSLVETDDVRHEIKKLYNLSKNVSGGGHFGRV